MRLAEPGWLVLLVLLPLPWFLARSRPRLAWPTLDVFTSKGTFRTAVMVRVGPLLRSLAIVGMAVGLARPQTVGGQTHIAAQGVANPVHAVDGRSQQTLHASGRLCRSKFGTRRGWPGEGPRP